VRREDDVFRGELDAALAKHRNEIDAVLAEYHVPRLDLVNTAAQ
jgi:mxaJ protein